MGWESFEQRWYLKPQVCMLRKVKTGPWRSLHFRGVGEEEGLKKNKEEKQESEESRKSGRAWLCRIQGRREI